MIIYVEAEDSTVLIDPSADRTADVEGNIHSCHRTPPRRNGGADPSKPLSSSVQIPASRN